MSNNDTLVNGSNNNGVDTLESAQLLVETSPHIRSSESVAVIMWQVNLALVPAVLMGVITFGLPALLTILLSIAGAVGTEAAVLYWQKKPVAIKNGSAFLTGILLAMCLPPGVPWYMPILGGIVAIGVAKMMMGGLGHNVFNPAHVGRAFLLASYPVAMTTFSASRLAIPGTPPPPAVVNFFSTDAISSATPLGILKHGGYEHLLEQFGGQLSLYKTLLIGNHAGSLGETSAILLALGGIYLAFKGYIKWQTPLVMLATIGILGWIFGGNGHLFGGDPLFHMISGGAILGAFFMATDPVTVPVSIKGQMLFAFGAGALTILIRLIGGYPEGVCYAILLMNAVTPMIDRWLYTKKFGSA